MLVLCPWCPAPWPALYGTDGAEGVDDGGGGAAGALVLVLAGPLYGCPGDHPSWRYHVMMIINNTTNAIIVVTEIM